MPKDVPFVVAPVPSEDPKKKETDEPQHEEEKPKANGVDAENDKIRKEKKEEELVRRARFSPSSPAQARRAV
jgi:hypothetical protein